MFTSSLDTSIAIRRLSIVQYALQFLLANFAEEGLASGMTDPTSEEGENFFKLHPELSNTAVTEAEIAVLVAYYNTLMDVAVESERHKLVFGMTAAILDHGAASFLTSALIAASGHLNQNGDGAIAHKLRDWMNATEHLTKAIREQPERTAVALTLQPCYPRLAGYIRNGMMPSWSVRELVDLITLAAPTAATQQPDHLG